jgi:VanZ family protein
VAEQPWRNPRPAPQLQEMQPRLHKLLIPSWIRAWWPALIWACIIFTLSTDSFSSEHTATILLPLVRWLFPHLTHQQFSVIHHLIRKSAHFTEYFIFCVLLFRGFRGDHRGWHWTWGISALSVAAGYSIMDEIHQAFVASRGASPYDSLLDSLGAFFAFAVIWLWFYFRRPGTPALPNPASQADTPAS